jgi:hypothetical protein
MGVRVSYDLFLPSTGNDITFTDAEGNEVKENHVHDVQFVGNQIKRINVYSRPASDD